MSKLKTTALIAVVILIAMLVVTAAILPSYAKNRIVEGIQQATGRKTALESLSINPLTLTVTANNLLIEDKSGGPFVKLGQLRTSLNLASIFKRALIINEVSLDSPAVSFTRTAANQYSFTDIIESIKSKPESKGETLFSINNISVKNGSVDFNDQAVTGGRKHTIRNLEVAIPFISNISHLAEKYTDPKISAVVNGAPFIISGKTKPLSKSLETSLRIDLKQLQLAELSTYSPQKLPADLTSGSLSADINVSYLISKEKRPELTLNGLLRLNDIAINLINGQPLLKLPTLELKAAKADIFNKTFTLESLTLDQLELFIRRDKQGKWMYEQLLNRKKTETAAKTESATQQALNKTVPQPLLQVAAFAISNGRVHFRDDVAMGGFRGEASQIDITIKDFSTATDKTASYDLSILLDNESTLNADGTFSLTPLKATVSSELSDVKLERGWPYLSQIMNAPVKGTATISSEATYSSQDGVRVEQGTYVARGLSTRYGNGEGISIGSFEVSGASYNQKDNTLTADLIKMSRGDITLSREPDGSISLLSLFKKPSQMQPRTESRKPKPAVTRSAAADRRTPTRDFSFRFKQIQLDRLNSTFTDKTLKDKPRFSLHKTTLNVANLNGPKFTPARLDFSSTFNRDTPLKAKGDITPYPFRYKGNISVGRLPIRDFEAYFPSNINVFILAGLVDTTTNLDLAIKDGKPVGSFSGNAGIRSFHCLDSVAEDDLLTWESLQLDEIAGKLDPFSLSIRQVALNNAYSRIVIRKDGTLNLQNLVQKPTQVQAPAASAMEPIPAPKPTASAPSAPAQTTPKDNTAARSPVSIAVVTIQDGTLSFTDNHLSQQFASTFYNLGGRVSGLTSEETKFADVDLRGNLENHSPLQITGRINPLREDLFVDLMVSFKDIDLTPATPYSGTYLGYAIDKGKLFLDLKYLIDKKQLSSQNRVFIDQFTFGKEVKSAQATNLPVRLAIALLKDRKGEIHLNLPVSGRTDDPQFSIWGVVWQVVKNLFVKAATSPFALMSSMFGEGQDFSTISFESGLSRLSPAEEKKMTALAALLSDRPALKLEIMAYVDRDKDTEGYRQELLNQKLRQEKFLTLAKERQTKFGDKAENIQVMPEEMSRYLKAVYAKEKFPKPRNMFGLVKDLPDSEMKKLIITNTQVADKDLQALARERAMAVMNYLVSTGGLPSERLFQKMDDIYKAPEKSTDSKSRVEFTASAH